jgi:hypothetical protein
MIDQFKRPMDDQTIHDRLIVYTRHNPIYQLAVEAAGHQGMVVDQLSWKLKKCLPAIIAELAEEIDRENEQAAENSVAPAKPQQ